MIVSFKFIRVDGTVTTHSDELRGEPGNWYKSLHDIFAEFFGDDIEMEHVNVWHKGKYTDMFVDETGVLKGLPINPKATEIYRANVLAHEVNPPNPNDMPPIHGDALLFEQKVCF